MRPPLPWASGLSAIALAGASQNMSSFLPVWQKATGHQRGCRTRAVATSCSVSLTFRRTIGQLAAALLCSFSKEMGGFTAKACLCTFTRQKGSYWAHRDIQTQHKPALLTPNFSSLQPKHNSINNEYTFFSSIFFCWRGNLFLLRDGKITVCISFFFSLLLWQWFKCIRREAN